MRYWIVVIKNGESRVLDDTSYTSFDYAEYSIKWLEKNPIFEGCTFTIGIEMMQQHCQGRKPLTFVFFCFPLSTVGLA